MRYLIADALRLWKDISDSDLPLAVDMGIKDSGSFQATSGGVAKAWEKRTLPKTLELGQPKVSGALALEEGAKWRAYWDGLTEEEKIAENDFNRDFWRGMQRKVGGV